MCRYKVISLWLVSVVVVVGNVFRALGYARGRALLSRLTNPTVTRKGCGAHGCWFAISDDGKTKESGISTMSVLSEDTLSDTCSMPDWGIRAAVSRMTNVAMQSAPSARFRPS